MAGIRKLFISYRHTDGDWVWNTLVPVLKAAGGDALEILIDRDKFELGRSVVGQMDDLQDQADASLLVLTPEYLESEACRHEMDRAVKADPKFASQKVIPVLRKDGGEPEWLKVKDLKAPLWCDLRDDLKDGSWILLFNALEISDGLGVSTSKWLKTAREIVQIFGNEQKSINLVTSCKKANWRSLFHQILLNQITDFGEIDLDDPRTVSRPGLLSQILKATGGTVGKLPNPPEDMEIFGERLQGIRDRKLAIRHFDNVQYRNGRYENEIFTTLRYAVEKRHLCLLVQSITPARKLFPTDHPCSEIDFHIIEL